MHLPIIANRMDRLKISTAPFSSYAAWLFLMMVLIGLPSFVIVWIHFVHTIRGGKTGLHTCHQQADAA